ncbi:hypothetical protein FRC20_006524 [Serendipita sp. 405]|nr:hypothetical protein FRC20_006524 [Serendipita sp. 405]
MHFTKRRAVVSLVFLGLLAFSWSIWAHFVKIEHDIDRMITDIGRGGQSGFFLFGSLDRVSIEEAKVSIRTIVLACGAQYLPLLVDYMPWSVVDENENVFCGIPVTPVVAYSVMYASIFWSWLLGSPIN